MSLILVLIVTVAISTAATGKSICIVYNTSGVFCTYIYIYWCASIPSDKYSTAVDYPIIVIVMFPSVMYSSAVVRDILQY